MDRHTTCRPPTSRAADAAATPYRRATAAKDANLLVRLDAQGKALVQQAAAARGLSVSDYVRTRMTALAMQDVVDAQTGVLKLSRDHQTSLWRALQNPPRPTAAQRRLGKLVRSVS